MRIVFSFYMDNIPEKMRQDHRLVLAKFKQHVNQIESKRTHAQAIDMVMKWAENFPDASVLFLDIDAIPLREGAIEYLFEQAEAGAICGIAQRANHIKNDEHIYCGSPVVALSVKTWQALGKPSSEANARGDVCEEWTHKAEELGVPVKLIYPCSFKAAPIRMSWETDTRPFWPLKDIDEKHRYGRGTFYKIPELSEEPALYHQFQSFMPGSFDMFTEECKKLLEPVKDES